MTTSEFNHQTTKPAESVRPVAQPSSTVQIEEMSKTLSTPRIAADFTPQGTQTRQVRTERDQETLRKIEEMRSRLESRRNTAKEAFTRGHNNATQRRTP